MMLIMETIRSLLRHLIPNDLEALFSLYREPGMRCCRPADTLNYGKTKHELTGFLKGHPAYPELGLLLFCAYHQRRNA